MNLLACRYIAGALLLITGAVCALLAVAALQSGADIRNAHANATEPLAWRSLNMAAQRSQSGEMHLD
jgi:hypothetical protein